MSLRPSNLPKLAQCACFESKSEAGPAAERGTSLDAAFHALVQGEPVPDVLLYTPIDADLEAVGWAVTMLHTLAGGEPVLVREADCRVKLLGMSGTADAIIPTKLAHADLKTGQKLTFSRKLDQRQVELSAVPEFLIRGRMNNAVPDRATVPAIGLAGGLHADALAQPPEAHGNLVTVSVCNALVLVLPGWLHQCGAASNARRSAILVVQQKEGRRSLCRGSSFPCHERRISQHSCTMNTPEHWQKILVPTDFSEDSLKAVREAHRFQQLTQSEVVLVHVTEPAFEGLRIHTGDYHDQVQRAAREQLKALVAEHFPGSSHVSTLVKDGRAGEVICDLARMLKVDAIFIATHGITAMKHFMLGSVAEKVVRHAPCSVLVVR